MRDSLHKTLTELEENDWGEPSFGSCLVTTVHKLRYKPIGDFTVEDLRITIGQSVGLPHLVPLAVSQLESQPLSEGDIYPGDLLHSVLSVDDSFWGSQHDLLARILPIAALAGQATVIVNSVTNAMPSFPSGNRSGRRISPFASLDFCCLS